MKCIDIVFYAGNIEEIIDWHAAKGGIQAHNWDKDFCYMYIFFLDADKGLWENGQSEMQWGNITKFILLLIYVWIKW